jgi:hypothetical protein
MSSSLVGRRATHSTPSCGHNVVMKKKQKPKMSQNKPPEIPRQRKEEIMANIHLNS